MYMEKMIEIGKVENGFVVECRVPIKSDKSKEADDVVNAYPGSAEKKFIATDSKKLMALLKQLIPLLDMDYVDEFSATFNKLAK